MKVDCDDGSTISLDVVQVLSNTTDAIVYEVMYKGKLLVLKADNKRYLRPKAFDTELRVLRDLSRKGVTAVPSVIDTGYTKDGKHRCFLMGPGGGTTLFDLAAANGSGLPTFYIKQFLRKIIKVVQDLHQANYLHLDIKPSNIIQLPDGSFQLIDFGAARKIASRGYMEYTREFKSLDAMLQSTTEQDSRGIELLPDFDWDSLVFTAYDLWIKGGITSLHRDEPEYKLLDQKRGILRSIRESNPSWMRMIRSARVGSRKRNRPDEACRAAKKRKETPIDRWEACHARSTLQNPSPVVRRQKTGLSCSMF
jgi:serine/threonine protein kinase